MKLKMRIYTIGKTQPILFAAEELSRILTKVTGESFEICKRSVYAPVDGLWLGCFDAFSVSPLKAECDMFDDEIMISVRGKNGIIAGLNDRSVLLAAYRYVTEIGCRFTSFGEEGEYLPETDLNSKTVKLQERAYYKHRGVCIEGAVTEENVMQMVDLLPKLGMNSYFIQFREAYTFFDRYYRHEGNPKLESKEAMPVSLACEHVKNIVQEIKKRGLIYHAVGHGWTCEPFGVPGLAWEEWKQELDEETLSKFALINGKRGLWGGVPLNTNACYSNSNVREKIINEICGYLKEHRDVDLLHFWLADGINNQCECEECRKHLPSDYYVMLLNELDEKLSELNINTKIVFLIYVDLLWPPKEFKLTNQERFLIMFAPITRTYRKSFKAEGKLPSLTEYNRNNNVMPRDVALNIAFLKEWQKMFHGSGFDYDYHYMWEHVNDPGYVQIAKILSEDIKNLTDLGLDGYISCQVSRTAFPNALGLYVMGKTLWNRDSEFRDICGEYFMAAYGDKWESVFNYLSKLSKLYFEINFDDIKSPSNERIMVCNKITELMDEFKDQIGFDIDSKFKNQRASWSYLKFHFNLWRDYTKALQDYFEGDLEGAEEKWDQVLSYAFESEEELQNVLDVWNFANIGNKIFKNK